MALLHIPSRSIEFLKLASVLGGRFRNAWIWNWWMALCAMAISGRARFAEDPSFGARMIFLVVAACFLFCTYCMFLSLQDARPVAIRMKVGPIFRLAVWCLPFLALLAAISPFVIR
jgi:hypothetical protein